MKVVVVGAGYVGLVTGTCLATCGHEIVCVDSDKEKVGTISNGQSPIFESGLEGLIRDAVGSRKLQVTTDFNSAFEDSKVSIIAVGTPYGPCGVDLSAIKNVAMDIARWLAKVNHYHVVIVKSTVPPGTTEKIVGKIIEEESGKTIGDDFGLVMNPEFLAEGTAVRDFMVPDRIVIGASDKKAATVVKDLYQSLPKADVVVTNLPTAETIKYAANSFLAATISFSNEMANLCAAIDGVDVVDVLESVQLDSRLSPLVEGRRIRPGLMSYLHPGIGFGGSCFPKDLQTFASYGESIGYPMILIEAVIEINKKQTATVVDILEYELGVLNDKKIGILGLAFKPGTDDVRHSPAIHLIEKLLRANSAIVAHDPIAVNNFQSTIVGADIHYEPSLRQLVNSVDAVVLVTAWPEYQNIHRILDNCGTLVVDARRYLDKSKFQRYRGVGRSRLSNETD